MHAVRFDERGFGVQAGIHGAHFDDPPDAFSTGMIDGSSVWCVSMAQQLRFDSGYPLRQRDRHDLATPRALVSRLEVNVDRPDG